MKYFLLAFISFSAVAAPVTIKFKETNNKAGKIYYSIYNDAAFFPDQATRAVAQGTIVVGSDTNAVSKVFDLPKGDYAISVFLDENGNGKLDKNLLGIPKERFGFSNNPRITTSAPSYSECEIVVTDTSKDFVINLMKLF